MAKNNFKSSIKPFFIFARLLGIFPDGRNLGHKQGSPMLTFSFIYAFLFTTSMSILSIDCGLVIIEDALFRKVGFISATINLSFGIGLLLQMFVKCGLCVLGVFNGPGICKVITEISKYDNKFSPAVKVNCI